ncbi:MAG: twin-arginine translocase subunit TatB, partial [Rhodospirillaceae bacterium]|nr:twin-arginine translocase subunit TatB [Rhodospirillaceae bacterium]
MLDIGWTEILIVMGIAIVVVGPKELPKVLRTVGKWRGKASAYARDFQRSIEDAADYSEMDAVKKEIEEANRELNDAKRDLGDQAAAVKSDMDAATKDTTVLKVDSDGSV